MAIASVTRRTILFMVLLLSGAALFAAESDVPRIDGGQIGFDGYFKVGHWTPLFISAIGIPAGDPASIAASTIDGEGVPVEVKTPLPVEASSAKALPCLLYLRVGRLNAPVEIVLADKDARVYDRKTLPADSINGVQSAFTSLPSTGELILELGGLSLGVAAAVEEQESPDSQISRALAKVADVESLPPDWFGYDTVDLVILPLGDEKFCRRLMADANRMSALERWIELGGRLVICGSENSATLLVDGQPLARFVPGQFAEVVRLPQAEVLEIFAASTSRIGGVGGQPDIPVPRLENVRGVIELYGRGNDLPLIVRTAYGLGEITFVGLDLDRAPLADWPGRRAIWQAVLRPYLELGEDEPRRAVQTIVSLGYDDLAGALRQRLGRSFAGITTISFPVVALLVIAYMLLIGPIDYLFCHKLTQKPWLAWWTLPLVVLGTGAGALSLASGAKDSAAPRLNSAEIVDFDLTTGNVRGTCWSTLYSPGAQKFDVTLLPQLLVQRNLGDSRRLVTWSGLPGSGLGGMHAPGEAIDVAGVGYRQSRDLDSLLGVPVMTAATKSFLAHWYDTSAGGVAKLISGQLSVDDDGLVIGSLKNDSGAMLEDACLLHGQWGYRLGDLSPGQELELSPANATRVRSIVARRAGYDIADQRSTFLADRATASGLLNVLMFFEAVGGEGFAGLPSRYFADCDLSRLLELDRAILVANSSSGSQWIDAKVGDSLADKQDEQTVVLRFVLPLNPWPQAAQN